jgi:hypothetical protein
MVNAVRQMQISTAESLVPEPNHFEAEIAKAKLKVINH